MTLTQLHYLIVIAKTGSLNKAAEQLYVAQPSLTSAVKELEKELGIVLLHRSGRGVTLTNDGAEFLLYAKLIYGQYENVLERYGGGSVHKKKSGVSTQHYSFAVKAFVEMVRQLEPYPCLSFEQGDDSSFYLAEEILATNDYPRTIEANDRATMLNLMVGLNGYTLCSGIICEELNGDDYLAIPFADDQDNQNSTMEIGYVVREDTLLSRIGELYVNELEHYLRGGGDRLYLPGFGQGRGAHRGLKTDLRGHL